MRLTGRRRTLPGSYETTGKKLLTGRSNSGAQNSAKLLPEWSERMSKEANAAALSKFAEAVNTGNYELFSDVVATRLCRPRSRSGTGSRTGRISGSFYRNAPSLP